MSWTEKAIAQPATGTPPQASPGQSTTPPPTNTPGNAPPANTPSDAPAELTTALSQIDAAANQRNLGQVMHFFSPSFTHSDGLTYQTFQNALKKFWDRYPRLTYQTTLNRWERNGDAIVADTTTTVTGTQQISGRDFTLKATITSRQQFVGGKIVRQDILTEQNQLTTGENPPQVEVSLPGQVPIARSFNFDAIVQEPLRNRLLLGVAVEEPIRPNAYLTPTPINLELLSAGGLFKVGQAPALPDSRWISAVIVREDGMTLETRRLQVVGRE